MTKAAGKAVQMPGSSKLPSSAEFSRVVYEQLFAHCRHIEVMRQGFTTIWAAILAGVLTFVGQSKEGFLSNEFTPIVGFLMMLTSLGLLVSWRLASTLKVCTDIMSEILVESGAEAYDPTTRWARGISASFRLRTIFIWLYVAVDLGEAAWLALLLK